MSAGDIGIGVEGLYRRMVAKFAKQVTLLGALALSALDPSLCSDIAKKLQDVVFQAGLPEP